MESSGIHVEKSWIPWNNKLAEASANSDSMDSMDSICREGKDLHCHHTDGGGVGIQATSCDEFGPCPFGLMQEVMVTYPVDRSMQVEHVRPTEPWPHTCPASSTIPT